MVKTGATGINFDLVRDPYDEHMYRTASTAVGTTVLQRLQAQEDGCL